MESGIDRPNGDPFLVKRLPLLFFNSAFAVAYAGFLLRETSVRTYATELAYLIPGFLCLFFAACGPLLKLLSLIDNCELRNHISQFQSRQKNPLFALSVRPLSACGKLARRRTCARGADRRHGKSARVKF